MIENLSPNVVLVLVLDKILHCRQISCSLIKIHLKPVLNLNELLALIPLVGIKIIRRRAETNKAIFDYDRSRGQIEIY